MRVNYNMALEIASHEAIIRQAYKDSAGVWTWSVGLTSATGHNVTRYIDKPQSLRHCLAVYAWALNKYAKQVEEAFAPTKLTEHQFAAALSFHWNTGAIKRASWVKLFKQKRLVEAKKSFLSWNKPAAIIGRREKEAELFFSGKWSNDGGMTEYMRLTANHTPVWSSARRINVEKDLALAFGAPEPPVRPVAPDVEPAVPQASPVAATGFWAWLRSWWS